jgi:hypothetical protein
MKIRADYVTNSSSVSYIVSWSPEMSEFIRLKNSNFNGNKKKLRIYQALTEDLKNTGEKVVIDKNSIFVKKYGFMKKTECIYDLSFDVPVESVDFEALDDNTLWAYIRGEYLVNAKLSSELKGFGSVQVPRDLEAFKQKYCDKITCNDCPKQFTDQCFKVTNG